jgi:hypothetical protein
VVQLEQAVALVHLVQPWMEVQSWQTPAVRKYVPFVQVVQVFSLEQAIHPTIDAHEEQVLS